MIQENIQKIKDQNMFGVIIEVGAGMPVYNELCQHANTASKIVKYAESPNNWDYSKTKYEFSDGIRAVSAQVCAEISNWQYCKMRNKSDDNFNFILSNTIQICNDNKTQTHGWFGLAIINNDILLGENLHYQIKFYHFSINNDGSFQRRDLTSIIANIGIDILASNNDCRQLKNGFIDIILDHNLEPIKSDIITSYSNAEIIKSINYLNPLTRRSKIINDVYTVFTKDGSVIRINDLIRQTKEKNIIIFKGSFNPIHSQHLVLMQKAKEETPDSVIFLQISMNNRDNLKNSDITNQNILKRITILNKLGYNVIINYNGYVNDAYEFYLNLADFADKKLYFLMGEDTILRFIADEKHSNTGTSNIAIDYKFCNFLYGKRNYDVNIINVENIRKLDIEENSISSTQIRSLIRNNNINELENLVGKELTQIIIDIYGK